MDTRFVLLGWALAAGAAGAVAQTEVDLRTQAKSIDFSGASSTKPLKAGSALPGTCSVGELFFQTIASPGFNVYVCAAANTWNAVGSGAIQSGAGAPVAGCAAGLNTYLDTTNLDYWFCDVANAWKKLVSTTNSGPFSLTGQTGPTPATPGAGFATLYLNSTDKTLHTVSDAGSDMRYAGLGEANTWGPFLQDFSAGTVKLPPANARRVCMIIIGADNGPALVTADIQPQKSQCDWEMASTVYQVIVLADAGASTVQVGYRHSGSTTAISPLLTAATVANITGKVACANAGGTAITIQGVSVTCSALTNTAITAGDWGETIGGTADAVTKRLSVSIATVVN